MKRILILGLILFLSSMVFAGPNENTGIKFDPNATTYSNHNTHTIGNITGYHSSQVYVEGEQIRIFSSRDTIPPSFTISHIENGDVTIQVTSDEDLYAGWVGEKLVWSATNFDYWWLNSRIAKDSENNIYAAVKLYGYSHPNSNFDMYKLLNNGEIDEEHLNWNGPSGNPVIINNPDENIYLGQPTLDREGVVDNNNITYIASNNGGSNILFTKIDADGTVLINNETIITGANGWTNEIRIAVDSNGKIYLVWSKDMHDISYAYSVDGGNSWSDIISLCYHAGSQENKPQVCCDNNDNVQIIWSGYSGGHILKYMKLRPDGSIAIDESILTSNDNSPWSPKLAIDEENNIHIVWANGFQNNTSACYTKINGNLDANGASMTDDELTLIQEQPFLSNMSIRYPKCAVDNFMNIHAIYENDEYGCNYPKAVYYKKMNSIPLLRIECPNDSVLFVEMTGNGTCWEGTFTPSEIGIYDIRVSGSDIDGNTGVDIYQFDYNGVNIDGNELLNNYFCLSNYPNPFIFETTISFNITAKNVKDATLEIYNIKGEKIRTFNCHPELVEGQSSIQWDGKDEIGKQVSSGIYFYKLKVGNEMVTKNMLLLK